MASVLVQVSTYQELGTGLVNPAAVSEIYSVLGCCAAKKHVYGKAGIPSKWRSAAHQVSISVRWFMGQNEKSDREAGSSNPGPEWSKDGWRNSWISGTTTRN
jgi:hypothetical protein